MTQKLANVTNQDFFFSLLGIPEVFTNTFLRTKSSSPIEHKTFNPTYKVGTLKSCIVSIRSRNNSTSQKESSRKQTLDKNQSMFLEILTHTPTSMEVLGPETLTSYVAHKTTS